VTLQYNAIVFTSSTYAANHQMVAKKYTQGSEQNSNYKRSEFEGFATYQPDSKDKLLQFREDY
jgi:hypothetical protein